MARVTFNPLKRDFWDYLARPESKYLNRQERNKAWCNTVWMSIATLGIAPAGSGIALGIKYTIKKLNHPDIVIAIVPPVNPQDKSAIVPLAKPQDKSFQLTFYPPDLCNSPVWRPLIHFEYLNDNEEFNEETALKDLKNPFMRFFILIYEHPQSEYIFRLAVDGKVYKGYREGDYGVFEDPIQQSTFMAHLPLKLPNAYKTYMKDDREFKLEQV